MTNATNRTDRYMFQIHQRIPHPDTKNNVIWVRPTQPVVPAVKRRISRIHAKITFQDQLTTKDQSHPPPTAKKKKKKKIWLRNENSTTSPTSRNGCQIIQVKSMKS